MKRKFNFDTLMCNNKRVPNILVGVIKSRNDSKPICTTTEKKIKSGEH